MMKDLKLFLGSFIGSRCCQYLSHVFQGTKIHQWYLIGNENLTQWEISLLKKKKDNNLIWP